jgi:hypothetical protein
MRRNSVLERVEGAATTKKRGEGTPTCHIEIGAMAVHLNETSQAVGAGAVLGQQRFGAWLSVLHAPDRDTPILSHPVGPADRDGSIPRIARCPPFGLFRLQLAQAPRAASIPIDKLNPRAFELCGRKRSDAHHIRFVQPRALGRKASDEFTVPLWRSHHRSVHRAGDEQAWWQTAGIDPVKVARKLWKHTRTDQGQTQLASMPMPE